MANDRSSLPRFHERRRAPVPWAIGAVLSLACSCGEPSSPSESAPPEPAPPTWRSLTEFRTFGWPWKETRDADGGAGPRIEMVGRVPWIVFEYEQDAWTPIGASGIHTAPRVLPSFSSTPRFKSRQVVIVDGTPFEVRSISTTLEAGHEAPPGSFGFLDDKLCLVLPAGAPAPTVVRHLVKLPLGTPDGPRWQLDAGLAAGNGFLVASGRSRRIELEATDACQLSFSAFVAHAPIDGSDVVLRVTQDDRTVWERTLSQSDTERRGTVHASVELDAAERTRTLEFSVEGGLTIAGYLAPVVGPRLPDGPTPDALDGRPNIVVFLADTFRADGFESQRRFRDSDDDYRLDHLEELASSGRRFDSTWSTSTWTLPGHASLFTSMTSRQHGVRTAFSTLPSRAVTLAEVLRKAGYRTVAVTDGGYVSSSFGLGQGFEVFIQQQRGLVHSLDRATDILATGDGRPTFLFVQSYMPHNPFQPSAAARAELGLGADAPREEDVILDARDAFAGDDDQAWKDPAVVALRRLYRAQLVDFDDAFGDWHDRFTELGWDRTSHLFFTSDHGEAFGHHDWLMHIGPAYETLTRVPLVWVGPGVESGDSDRVTSIIDLAPTAARLAGAPIPAAWNGRDLTEPRDGGFAWSSWIPANRFSTNTQDRLDGRLTATNGRHRVHFDEAGERVQRVFDLRTDPDESVPLEVADSGWPSQFVERASEKLPAAVERLLPDGPRPASDPGLIDRLRALGYLGEDD